MRKHIKIDISKPLTGAFDFSHLLDAPAGVHGQTVVKDGSLYFEDGTRARFVGFNIPSGGMMPNHETAEVYAKRLASMGCNVVRLHAEDSVWNRDGISTIDYKNGGRTLNKEYMERLHYFIYQLKEKGIYVQVDLHCYRIFTNQGDLKNTPPKSAVKAMSIFNQELIDLQKQYVRDYLSAVNPYTGMSFLDDPVVMAIQITNENSVFFVNLFELGDPLREPFEEERKLRFNAFLLKKYGSREALEKAWTREGECGLLPYEDPEEGTVEPIEYGDYVQPFRDPRSYWVGLMSPARYADYMEYGMEINKHYYKEIYDEIKALGAKAPVNGCNLLHGIADIYSSTRTIDLSENNAYYNHPMGGSFEGVGVRYNWHYNVKTDPRKTTYPVFDLRDNNLIQQLAAAAVKGKPFVVSEWNEYGGMPFHSSAYLMQGAYACLQNWDGLMLYSFAQTDDYRNLKDDFIGSVFDIYNDPSVVGQFGAMATIFLKNRVSEAKRIIDMCYTMEDTKMLPENYKMPYGFLPFISKTRTVFLEDGVYADKGDVAVTAGFAQNGNYDAAKHAVVYARTKYADALEHEFVGSGWLDAQRGGDAVPFMNIGTLSKRTAVIDIDKIDGIERNADYTGFSRFTDGAMKTWGLWDEGTGLKDIDCFVSDTGELTFDFGNGKFLIDTPYVKVFTGFTDGSPIKLGPVTAVLKNDRMSLSLLTSDDKPVNESKALLIMATGETGNDDNKWAGDISLGFGGKLFVDDPEGTLEIPGAKRVYALDVYGNRIYELGKKDGLFVMGDEDKQAALGFEIIME